MSCTKIFDVYETDAEKVINGYLKAVYEKKHGVMGGKAHFTFQHLSFQPQRVVSEDTEMRTGSAPQRRGSLKKIPQPGEFNDLLGGQNSADQFSLRSGVDLVQMTQRCGFGHELPYALVQSAIRNEVGTRVADALVFE